MGVNNENTWTQGGEYHTLGPVRGWGLGEGRQRVGDWGGIALGEIPNVDDGVMDTIPWHVYTYIMNLHTLHMYPRT